MSADALLFEEWAGSGRGLTARPTAPGNFTVLAEHVESMTFAVYDLNAGGAAILSGDLVVEDCMLDAPAAWLKDKTGYTCLIQAPGTWWPTAAEPGQPQQKYRIVITFVLKAAVGGFTMIEVWEASTKDPAVSG